MPLMRIALVIRKYDALGGGAERWTDRHARMLLDRGHEVHLIACRFRGAPDHAVCHTIPERGPTWSRRIRFAHDVQAHLREHSFDVVHDMGDGWCADILMPHHGTRRMGFRRNTELAPPSIRWTRRFAYRLFPRYLEFQQLERRQFTGGGVRLFLAVSPMIEQHMHVLYHVPRDRIRVVYNGVDPSHFRPATDARARRETRSVLGLDDATVFLMVAHNFRLKGLDTLLEAMAALKKGMGVVSPTIPNGTAELTRTNSSRPLIQPRLIVVGDGNVPRYEAMARQLGCADVVRFLGDQPDPIPYFQAANVFVLPTYYDPCSLVALEAMASGLPTITSTRNGVHELMTDGREGYIIDDPADADALADRMRRSMDPTWRTNAARAARALATEHSVEQSFEKHLAVYREVVAKKSHVRSAAAAESSLPREDAQSVSA